MPKRQFPTIPKRWFALLENDRIVKVRSTTHNNVPDKAAFEYFLSPRHDYRVMEVNVVPLAQAKVA